MLAYQTLCSFSKYHQVQTPETGFFCICYVLIRALQTAHCTNRRRTLKNIPASLCIKKSDWINREPGPGSVSLLWDLTKHLML